ncbi:MAG: metalloregulator ArsR/SmtB family transcription factor [Coriobacteriia bacterium]|nr:metalloregulator ArsR/SmtB family transcription factor [Coriobacteriia bacterium]
MDIDVLKALADERRLAIVEMLTRGELCVCELAEGLGISDALVSHHVKKLRAVGLIRTRKVGQWLHCSLEPAAFVALAETFSALADVAEAAPGGIDGCACTTKRGRA